MLFFETFYDEISARYLVKKVTEVGLDSTEIKLDLIILKITQVKVVTVPKKYTGNSI